MPASLALARAVAGAVARAARLGAVGTPPAGLAHALARSEVVRPVDAAGRAEDVAAVRAGVAT